MAKKRGKIIQLAKFRESHRTNEDVRTSEEERGSNARSKSSHTDAAERRAAAPPLDFQGMDRTLALFSGDDEVSHNCTLCAAGNPDP
jgi:hypothetical protein